MSEQTNNIFTSTELGNNGRLGNQLFQIAACFGVSVNEKGFVLLPEWNYKNCFKNKYIIPTAEILSTPINVYREESFSYNPITINSFAQNKINTNVNALFGYFQSEKYFKHIEALIRKLFEPSEEILKKLQEKYPLFRNGAVKNACSIHVRRGDYVNNPYYAQLGMDYYNSAMWELRKMKQGHYNLIFSDDIEWCKQNFEYNPNNIFIEGNSDIEDLFLMSWCRYNIGANSSFSWWGAWLNNQEGAIKIFPKKWFGEVAKLDTKDLYLQSWITI